MDTHDMTYVVWVWLLGAKTSHGHPMTQAQDDEAWSAAKRGVWLAKHDAEPQHYDSGLVYAAMGRAKHLLTKEA